MKTHWKKLDNPNYLGAYSLMNGTKEETLTATIEKVMLEEVKTAKGSENCRVMYLKGQKPMILNTTNSKIIEKLFGTPFIEDWKGKSIIIYVAKIKAFGEYIDALRIKPELPKKKKKPELLPNTDNWNKAIEALKGGYTTNQIKSKYIISEINETKLMSDAI